MEATPKIDPEFRDLIPPLRADELRLLESSLKAEGCREPLAVWDGILIDGHNRLAICRRESIPFRVSALSFADRSAAKLWVIRNQLGRRNLSDLDRIALAKQAEPLIAAKAAANVKAAQETSPKRSGKASLNLAEPIDTRKEAAKLANVAPETYAKGKAVLESGSPDLVAAVREGKASIHSAAAVATLPKPVQSEVVARGEAEILAEAKRIREAKARDQREERERKRLADLKRRAEEAKAKVDPGRMGWEIVSGDCLAVFDERFEAKAERPRLIFADPPYNIGIDYGDHVDDKRRDEEFFDWLGEVIARAWFNLADDGSFWLLLNHEWGYRAAYLAENQGFTLRQWITWFESFGVNCSGKFNRCSRPLLWFVKDPARFVFHADAPEIRRESDRLAKYADPRANPDGKTWDDVWGINPPIPRLTGTAAERIPKFPTQLPLALVRPIVACASDPGDLVCDPFNGSGTTGVACIEFGRRYLGIEAGEDFAALSRDRLTAAWAARKGVA